VAGVVTIGCFHARLSDTEPGTAIVAVDVLRSTTTAVTGVASGRKCYPAASIEAAVPLAGRLSNPLLVGELGGSMPYGFHLQNSPAEIERRTDIERPMVLLSTSGTRLMCEAAASGLAYAACLRNVTAQVGELRGTAGRVKLLGADSRGDFRAEDQICCARIAAGLFEAGYEPSDASTESVVERWIDAPDDAFAGGRSAQYLLDTDQSPDLDFVLAHIDDVDSVFPVTEGQVVMRAQG
jgi:2-phosphosulfolactate phosphatase